MVAQGAYQPDIVFILPCYLYELISLIPFELSLGSVNGSNAE